MEVFQDVVAVFVFEEDAIVLEDVFEVRFLGFVDHLLVLLDLFLPKFLVNGQAIGPVFGSLEHDKIPEDRSDIDFIFVFCLIESFFKLP